jgi:hypothetical protein
LQTKEHIMGKISKNIVLFGGNSLPPSSIPIYEAFRQIGCILYVDMNTHKIEQASFTTVNSLTNEFLSDILIGHNLKDGIAPLIKEITERAQLASQKAFIKALEACYHRYQSFCQKKKE